MAAKPCLGPGRVVDWLLARAKLEGGGAAILAGNSEVEPPPRFLGTMSGFFAFPSWLRVRPFLRLFSSLELHWRRGGEKTRTGG